MCGRHGQALLHRQAHEEEIPHRQRSAQEIAQQHGVIPLADDQEHRLHQQAAKQDKDRDELCFLQHDLIHILEQTASHLPPNWPNSANLMLNIPIITAIGNKCNRVADYLFLLYQIRHV